MSVKSFWFSKAEQAEALAETWSLDKLEAAAAWIEPRYVRACEAGWSERLLDAVGRTRCAILLARDAANGEVLVLGNEADDDFPL